MSLFDSFEKYFLGNEAGFLFVVPGVALSGPAGERYDTGTHEWVVTHESAGQQWEARGSDRTVAYLNLIAARCGVDLAAREGE